MLIQFLCLPVVLFGPRDLESHELTKSAVDNTQPDVVGRVAKTVKVFLRKINTSTVSIFGKIPQNVGQLKGQSTVHRTLNSCLSLEAPDVDAAQPDNSGNVVAVIAQLVKGLMSALQYG